MIFHFIIVDYEYFSLVEICDCAFKRQLLLTLRSIHAWFIRTKHRISYSTVKSRYVFKKSMKLNQWIKTPRRFHLFAVLLFIWSFSIYIFWSQIIYLIWIYFPSMDKSVVFYSKQCVSNFMLNLEMTHFILLEWTAWRCA